jgi:hypothetical protein
MLLHRALLFADQFAIQSQRRPTAPNPAPAPPSICLLVSQLLHPQEGLKRLLPRKSLRPFLRTIQQGGALIKLNLKAFTKNSKKTQESLPNAKKLKRQTYSNLVELKKKKAPKKAERPAKNVKAEAPNLFKFGIIRKEKNAEGPAKREKAEARQFFFYENQKKNKKNADRAAKRENTEAPNLFKFDRFKKQQKKRRNKCETRKSWSAPNLFKFDKKKNKQKKAQIQVRNAKILKRQIYLNLTGFKKKNSKKKRRNSCETRKRWSAPNLFKFDRIKEKNKQNADTSAERENTEAPNLFKFDRFKKQTAKKTQK